MRNPLVSIIIPSFNYAHLIEETLQSVVDQRYRNWECIIIDDGSTDDTKQVVDAFIGKYSDLNFTFKIVENGGTSATKNHGIQLAKGKYIQFLDADDLLSEDKIAIQVELAEHTDAGLVFSESIFFTGDFSQSKFIQKYPEGFLAKKSLQGFELLKALVINNILTISSPLVNADLIKDAGLFTAELRNNEDWLFWFKIAQIKPSFQFDNDPKSATYIRVHGQSAMTNHSNMFKGEVFVREYLRGQFSISQAPTTMQLKRLNSDLLALHQIRSLEISTGFSHIFSSFLRNPFHGLPLLVKGGFKLAVRIYKNIRN